MKYLIAALFVLLTSITTPPAYADGAANTAQTLDVSKLTAEQQKALTDLATQFTANQTNVSSVLDAIKGLSIDQKTMSTWAVAGTEAGKAVANFTEEIKMPVGQVLDSFQGKVLFLMFFMNYGGGKLASFGLDVGLFLVLTPIFLLFMRGVFRRFVLHMRMDVNKKWTLFRSKAQGEALVDPKEFPTSVNTSEAVFGLAFIVVGSFFYFAWMWPAWPV